MSERPGVARFSRGAGRHLDRQIARAVRVAPHYAEAYYHLVDDAVVHRDRERVAELAAAYDSLKDLGVGCDGLRILHQYLRGSPEACGG